MYNKGENVPSDNFYISHWFDPDLGYSSDDLVGCDTLDQCFFCFNSSNADGHYGTPVPAIGVKMLAGPVVPSPLDTAYWDGYRLQGYRNLGMSSFQLYINGTDPNSATQTLNYMQGLAQNGSPLPNGTRFAVPGNPVAGTGDLDTNPRDKRMMGTFGPIDTFRPGDSQCVLIVMAVGTGTNNLSSITVTKSYLDQAEPPLPALAKTTVNPDPIYQFMTQSIEPTDIAVNLGYDMSGAVGHDFDPGTICVNGICSFDSINTAAAMPGFSGNVTRVFMPVADFIGYYGLLWDSASYDYTVTGNYTDGSSFSLTGQAILIGHRTGDLNLDGIVDISDLIEMVEFAFNGGPEPDPMQAADMNHDGAVGIGDLVLLVEEMF